MLTYVLVPYLYGPAVLHLVTAPLRRRGPGVPGGLSFLAPSPLDLRYR
ncbi:MAG: hypothetical protein ACLGI3_04490 [Actinomycetes bacterium]